MQGDIHRLGRPAVQLLQIHMGEEEVGLVSSLALQDIMQGDIHRAGRQAVQLLHLHMGEEV